MMKSKAQQNKTSNSDDPRRSAYIAIAVMITLALTGLFLYFQADKSRQPKAAIIDQLSSSQLDKVSRFPNPVFVETAKQLLYKRFPEVEYYSDNATVDQYRYLPSLGYELIVWRVHSALDEENHFVAVCSSERYNPEKYQQYSGSQLTLCNITNDPNLYFAITPNFVHECMSGKFKDTIIILMSCNGLKERFHKTADAFIEKGARVFISWDGWIRPSDNDHAITLLLEYLINENNTIRDAVDKVPDYYYMSVPCALGCYPREAAEFRIPAYNQDKTACDGGLVTAAFLRRRSRLEVTRQPRISTR